MNLKIIIVASAAAAAAATIAQPPTTTKAPVTDTYHGVKVTDDYRWLENPDDPKVQAWSDAQNAHARTVLDAIPHAAQVRERAGEVLAARSVSYASVQHAGGKFFAMKRQPPKQQPFLVVMDSPHHPDTARIVLDPTVLDPTGGTAIDWFVPSLDGTLVAISLSKGGSESGDLHLFDAATGKLVEEPIARVYGGTAGGDAAWAPDSRGLFYTRYPRDGERPADDLNFYMQVYYHQLGTPSSQDRYEMGKDLPRIAEIQLDSHQNGTLLANIQKGDGGEFIHFVRPPTPPTPASAPNTSTPWHQFTQYEDQILQASLGADGSLYLVSAKDAPRGKLLRIDAADITSASPPSLADARTVIDESTDTLIAEFWYPAVSAVTPHAIYLTYQLGGPSEIRVFDLEGRPLDAPIQLPVSTVGGLTPLGGGRILFSNVSYVEPLGWYLYEPPTEAKPASTTKTALSASTPLDFSKYQVLREFATSKDGTKVPVNIVLPRGAARDGTSPCIVTGYGGYGVNISPGFSAADLLYLEQGVILAEANIRGGGEFGEEWHRQGNLTNKQNVFDDFAAAIEHMIARNYTSSDRLGIVGGSNGGLLMGAIVTQHPGLARAVVSHVGIYDMLRVELTPNGAFNVPEFGTVQDESHFRALHAYSPYHHVENATPYPAILFMTGANDPRVDPWHSRKMTARLQAATSSDHPVLLRTSHDSGHGQGTPLTERIAQTADAASFFFHYLGVDYTPAEP